MQNANRAWYKRTVADRARLSVLVVDDEANIRKVFREVIGGDTSFGRKPSPAGLKSLAQTEQVDPASVLLVGDSAIDLATARNCGTRVCLARYGFGFRFAPADGCK